MHFTSTRMWKVFHALAYNKTTKKSLRKTYLLSSFFQDEHNFFLSRQTNFINFLTYLQVYSWLCSTCYTCLFICLPVYLFASRPSNAINFVVLLICTPLYFSSSAKYNNQNNKLANIKYMIVYTLCSVILS